MAKDNFFEEEEDLEEEKPGRDDSDKGKDPEKTPEKKGEEAPEKKGEGSANDDGVDWKAKYEAAEEAKKQSQYFDELLHFDPDLEGETLEEVHGGKDYRKLRELGLSPKRAYAALTAEDEKDNGGTPPPPSKRHIGATDFRSTHPKSRMDRDTRDMVDDVFGDSLSREEKEALWKRVK